MLKRGMHYYVKGGLAIFLLSLVTVATAYAGGLEQGNFNGEAVVLDARATASNPAALAIIESSQVVGGAAVIASSVEFKDDGNTTVPGGDGGDAGDTIAGGGFSLAHKVNPNLGLGVSLTAPWGGSVDYDDGWSGRYIVTYVDLLVFALTGSVGYKVNDWLSLGAGVSVDYASFEQKLNVKVPSPPAPPGTPDLEADIDTDDTQVGFTLGALLMPRPGTRIGIAYRSEVDFDLGGDLTLTGVVGGTTSLSAGLPGPQRVVVSLFQELNESTSITADVGWSDYSAFDTTQIDFASGAGISIPRNWEDTYRVGFGIQHHIAPKWGVNAGITYDSSPVEDEDRTPDLPIDRQIMLSANLAYEKSEKMTLGLGYTYIDLGDAKLSVTNGANTLSGEYDTNRVQILALSMIYKY